MKTLINKLFNRETITYVIFGVITTVVNYAVYILLYRFTDIDILIDNVIAWIVAVLVAFITNKLFVFESKSFEFKTLMTELGSFITARLLSLLFETGFLALTVKGFKMNELIAKVIACVVVVILNYFASKFLIFRKKEEKNV